MSSPILVRSTAIAVGLAADRILGEPPTRWHPVARFGSLMQRVERSSYADNRAAGTLHAAVGIGVATATAVALRRLFGPTTATALAVAVCSAGRMLDDEATTIAVACEHGDLATARVRLQSLVGRDTESLDQSGISRAVIESVAENSVDAVTASMWWAAVAGAPGALVHRAVNTLDAMVGHRDERYTRFGWASARLDDVANFVPARLGVLAVALVRPHRAADIVRIVRRDAAQHPSPNGGVIEAAYAAALGVSLGGTNHYRGVVEDRGVLGDGTAPSAGTIHAAVRLRRHSVFATVAILTALGASARSVLVVLRRP